MNHHRKGVKESKPDLRVTPYGNKACVISPISCLANEWRKRSSLPSLSTGRQSIPKIPWMKKQGKKSPLNKQEGKGISRVWQEAKFGPKRDQGRVNSERVPCDWESNGNIWVFRALKTGGGIGCGCRTAEENGVEKQGSGLIIVASASVFP